MDWTRRAVLDPINRLVWTVQSPTTQQEGTAYGLAVFSDGSITAFISDTWWVAGIGRGLRLVRSIDGGTTWTGMDSDGVKTKLTYYNTSDPIRQHGDTVWLPTGTWANNSANWTTICNTTPSLLGTFFALATDGVTLTPLGVHDPAFSYNLYSVVAAATPLLYAGQIGVQPAFDPIYTERGYVFAQTGAFGSDPTMNTMVSGVQIPGTDHVVAAGTQVPVGGGTAVQRVMRSTDGGATWTMVTPDPTRTYASVQYFPSISRLLMGGNRGWYSDDEGVTWTQMFGGSISQFCQVTDDVFVAAGSGWATWSQDRGQTWGNSGATYTPPRDPVTYSPRSIVRLPDGVSVLMLVVKGSAPGAAAEVWRGTFDPPLAPPAPPAPPAPEPLAPTVQSARERLSLRIVGTYVP